MFEAEGGITGKYFYFNEILRNFKEILMLFSR